MQLCPDFTNYSLETSPQGHTTKNPGIVWCLLSPNLQLLRCHSHSAVYVCYALGDYNTLKNPCYQNFVLQKQSLASIFYSASLCFFNLRVNMLSGENLLGTTSWRWTMTLQNLFRYSSHCVLRGLCNSRNSALACTKSVLGHFILPRCQSLTITFWGIFEFPSPALFACLQLLPVPSSQIVGKTQKKKACEKLAGRGKRRKNFLFFYFCVCTFSIQQTWPSRSLEQATPALAFRFSVAPHWALGKLVEEAVILSMSGQVEEANAVFQLVTQVSKIGLSYLCKISCFVPQEPTLFRPHDKSLTCIDHAY